MTTPPNKKKFLQDLAGLNIILEKEVQTPSGESLIAEIYLEVETISELTQAIKTARVYGIPYLVLGNASTLPEDQEEIAGMVIKNNCRKFSLLSIRGKVDIGSNIPEYVLLQAESGVLLNQLVRYALDEGYGGIEYFLGASGTVGDGVTENIFYEKNNSYLTQAVFTVRVLTKDGEVREIEAQDFFTPLVVNRVVEEEVTVLSAVFKLVPTDKKILWKRGNEAAFSRNQHELLDPLKNNFRFE